MKRAKIVGLQGSWNSGIATLQVEHEDGSRANLFGDNGPLVQALAEAFGGNLAGHLFDPACCIGQWVEYVPDEFGLCLAGFTPCEGA